MGPVVGALLLTFMRDFLSTVLIHVYPILVGVILIVSIVFFPKGIVGSIRAWRRARRLQEAPASEAAPVWVGTPREVGGE